MSTIEAWRAEKAALAALLAEHDRANFEMFTALRAAAVPLVAAKKRVALLPAPVAGEAPCWPAGASAYRTWRDAVPKTKREAYDLACAPHGAAYDGRYATEAAAHKAVRDAAAKIVAPVVGAPAVWRCVYSKAPICYASQGTGAATYARGAVALRYQELVDVGYQVRAVTRARNPVRDCANACRGTWSSHHLHSPHEGFEVWILTCAEGAEIAPHQYPDRAFDATLRACADLGCNPAAMWTGLPWAAVERAGADRAHDRPPPVPWENLGFDEPLPDKPQATS